MNIVQTSQKLNDRVVLELHKLNSLANKLEATGLNNAALEIRECIVNIDAALKDFGKEVKSNLKDEYNETVKNIAEIIKGSIK